MNFDLSPEAAQIVGQISRWNTRDRAGLGDVCFTPDDWHAFLRLGVLEMASDPSALLELTAALIETGKKAFPGPVLEAALAVRSGSKEAIRALGNGEIVTSITRQRKAKPQIVPWGAVATLVVDQETGETLARGPLPDVKMAYPLQAGWIDLGDIKGAVRPPDHARWVLSAAAVAGLGLGAVEMARTHALTRVAFGKPIGAYQSLQNRIVEAHVMIEAARLGALDSAWRLVSDADNPEEAGALAWLWAHRAGDRVRRHCHQVFGASGFCYETGLAKLTWQMDLIRLELGTTSAVRRAIAGRDIRASDPPVTVLAGYGAKVREQRSVA